MGLHGKPHGLMSSSQCSICQQELDRHAFSAKQLKNAAHRRKCLACVAAEESAERARIAATQRAEQLRKQELAAWVDANVTEPSTSLSEWTSEIMDATPHADVGTQSTAPFVVGSPGPPAPARRKGGRPPKATEDKAVRGYLWRCRLKSADDGGYDELQASLSGCPQITKLAMRRSPADSECIEAFAGFSGDRSNVQLSKLPGLPTGVQWERVIETRQGGEWSSVKADSTFSIMLPKEDAVESVRRGLQHELRVQPAWVDTHVPALSRVEAGAPILSPEGRHASRTISADVPTPSGEHVERREAQVDYDVPAAGGNAGAAARDSQRLREERALLSLDTAAEACERQQHREAEQLRRERQRCRRDELKALRDAREQILELLLARAQILKPGVGLERWARLVNLPCRTDTPSGRAVREVFFRKLRRQSSSYLQVPKDMPYSPHDHYHQTSLLLPQGVSSNVGWLCTLIHSLQSFTKWMHNTQELQCPLPPWVADAAERKRYVEDAGLGSQGARLVDFAWLLHPLPENSDDEDASWHGCDLLERFQVQAISEGLRFWAQGLTAKSAKFEGGGECPWLTDEQVTHYARMEVQVMYDKFFDRCGSCKLMQGHPWRPEYPWRRVYHAESNSWRVVRRDHDWTFEERVDQVALEHCIGARRKQLSPDEAHALAGAAALHAVELFTEEHEVCAAWMLVDLAMGAHVTVMGLAADSARHYNGQCGIVVSLPTDLSERYGVQLERSSHQISARRGNLFCPPSDLLAVVAMDEESGDPVGLGAESDDDTCSAEGSEADSDDES